MMGRAIILSHHACPHQQHAGTIARLLAAGRGDDLSLGRKIRGHRRYCRQGTKDQPPRRSPPMTRAKELHTPAEVIAAHYKVAGAFGHQAAHVVAEAKERALSQPEMRVLNAPQRAQEAVSYAKARGFEREAVTDERLLMRDALRRGMGDITYPQIRQNFDRW